MAAVHLQPVKVSPMATVCQTSALPLRSESLHQAGAAVAAAAAAAGIGAAACRAEADVAAPAGAGVAHLWLHAGDDAHVFNSRTRRGAIPVKSIRSCGGSQDFTESLINAHKLQLRVAVASVLRLHIQVTHSCIEFSSSLRKLSTGS